MILRFICQIDQLTIDIDKMQTVMLIWINQLIVIYIEVWLLGHYNFQGNEKNIVTPFSD